MTRMTGALDDDSGELRRGDKTRPLVRTAVHFTERCGWCHQAETHR